jgi:ornithine carbamoyltransferase
MNFLEIGDFSPEQIHRVFRRVDRIRLEAMPMSGLNVLALFPATSLRTRTTFELGIAQLGGRSVLFPPESRWFVGYRFKSGLLAVQQAIMLECLGL